MNAINWFEIPVNDLERAVQFYSAVLGRDMPRMDLGGLNPVSDRPGEQC